MEQSNIKSVSMYAMEYGTYFGLILIAKMVLSSFAQNSLFISTLVLLFLVAIPVVGYLFTKKFRDVSGYITFGKLFLFGALMFFYASLLSGIFDYLYYEYINPEYFQAQQAQVLSLVDAMIQGGNIEGDEELSNLLKQEIPSAPINLVFQSIWGTLIMGTLYALLLALFLKKKENTIM